MKSADEKEKQALGKMTAQLPDMERELTDLRASVKEKDDALREREKALQAMAVELDRREHRMVKAERMSDMLEKARSDLVQVSDREKRDMHFNMASVYARDGEYREAETEYLRALRIDPGDADAHYNLGILYDDHLDQKRKAALYYKRYLKLRPDATDVDQVKAWLLNIEMQTDK
jgi:tetratricopeptide (TPR) repeat protein